MASSVVRVLIDHIPDLGLDGMLSLVLKQPPDVRHHLLVLAVIIHLASFLSMYFCSFSCPICWYFVLVSPRFLPLVAGLLGLGEFSTDMPVPEQIR